MGHQFLTTRQQRVCVGNVSSSILETNTGAPQGCVMSPVLFVLYTNDCRSSVPNCDVIKYADDTAIVGHLGKSQSGLDNYTKCVDSFIAGCESNYLELNVEKTK